MLHKIAFFFPIVLRTKTKSYFTAHKAPVHVSNCVPLCFPLHTPAVAALLLLECHASWSLGILHMLFPMPEMLFPIRLPSIIQLLFF